MTMATNAYAPDQRFDRFLDSPYTQVSTGNYKYVSVVQDTPIVEPIEDRFSRWLNAWYEETQYSSSLTDIVSNENYHRILKLGEDAIPLILEELKIDPSIHLLSALTLIAEEDPVPDEYKGDIRKMAEFWLEWGNKHEYV